ncbi:hypothetical protein CDAR_309671 [Caerostris darwini]|uniref:Uncharacterized protein n=1 Tax=Caerostris darwini TaxID=1538125 RepID=A0AAV4W098_9ARAC|nr:hypothetical protein CDAR_309671 [Caerostris darwini]
MLGYGGNDSSLQSVVGERWSLNADCWPIFTKKFMEQKCTKPKERKNQVSKREDDNELNPEPNSCTILSPFYYDDQLT